MGLNLCIVCPASNALTKFSLGIVSRPSPEAEALVDKDDDNDEALCTGNDFNGL